MAAEPWPDVPFPEAIDFQEGPGILAKDFRKEGVPLVRLSGLERGGSVLEGCNYVDPGTVKQRWSHFALQEGDVLLSSSASLGRIAVVGRDGVGAIPYTGIIRMRPRDGRVYAPFIRYLLEAPDFQRQAEIAGVGSVMRHFGPMHLRQMTVQLPPPESQRAIAHILGTLDDKIELNRRMNETLEAIARALFKSWFVDFDPVRAKSEGRDPGLPPHLADLFPDSFEDSELGEIPKGWEVAPISAIADVIDCSHAKKPIRRAHGWPLLQLANIRSDGLLDMSDTYLIDRTEYEAWTARIEVSPGDCVITNVGRVGAVAQVPGGVRAALGRNMTALRCKMSFPFPTLLLEALVSDSVRNEVALNTDSGTILDSLNVRSIPKLRLVLPAANVACGFEALARPLRAKMELNLVESRSLGVLRDALLPKLISGELPVRHAERFAAPVGA